MILTRLGPLCLAATLATLSASAQNAPAPTTPTPTTTPDAPPAGESFTLDDAVAAMRRGHPLLSAARANVRAAEDDVVAAGLWTNPVFSASYTRSVGFTTYHSIVGMPQVGLTQLIETSGLPSARRSAAQLSRDASRYDARGVELSLTFDLRAAAVNLAEAQTRLQVHSEAVDDLAHAAQVVRARVDAGAAPRYDASRILIALADSRALLADAISDAVRARADLDVAVGPLAESLHGSLRFTLADAPALPPLAAMIDRMHDRPDLSAAQARAGAQLGQVEVARRSVVQGVNLYAGSVAGAGTDDQGALQVDLMVGVSVPLPIIDRGQGTIPAAEHRAEAARSVFDALSLAARQRVQAAWREVDLRRRTLDVWNESGTSGVQEMRHEAEVGYREGRLSILELVDAYTSFRDARLRGVELARDARAAEVLLGRAGGVALTGVGP